VDELSNRSAISFTSPNKSLPNIKEINCAQYLQKSLLRKKYSQRNAEIALLSTCGIIGSPSGIAYRELEKMFNTIRKDPKIKAVILRISSPGGTVPDSEEIWSQVVQTQKINKPVIVSMGDVAASGGYMIACPAKVIIAQPGTLTGSIGVLGGKFVLEDLLKQLDIKVETVALDQNAQNDGNFLFSPLHKFSEKDREIFNKILDCSYQDFKEKVAQGRSLPIDKVEEIAQGHVWTGEQALQLGLVDQLGGIPDAIKIARNLIGNPHAQVKEMKTKSWLQELSTMYSLTYNFASLFQPFIRYEAVDPLQEVEQMRQVLDK